MAGPLRHVLMRRARPVSPDQAHPDTGSALSRHGSTKSDGGSSGLAVERRGPAALTGSWPSSWTYEADAVEVLELLKFGAGKRTALPSSVSCGGLCHRDRQPGSWQLTVKWPSLPSASTGAQLQGVWETMTRNTAPHGCPRLHCVGQAHQSGNARTLIPASQLRAKISGQHSRSIHHRRYCHRPCTARTSPASLGRAARCRPDACRAPPPRGAARRPRRPPSRRPPALISPGRAGGW